MPIKKLVYFLTTYKKQILKHVSVYICVRIYLRYCTLTYGTLQFRKFHSNISYVCSQFGYNNNIGVQYGTGSIFLNTPSNVIHRSCVRCTYINVVPLIFFCIRRYAVKRYICTVCTMYLH